LNVKAAMMDLLVKSINSFLDTAKGTISSFITVNYYVGDFIATCLSFVLRCVLIS